MLVCLEHVVFGAQAGKVVVVRAPALLPRDGVIDLRGLCYPVAAGMSAGLVPGSDPVLEVFRWPIGGPADGQRRPGFGVRQDPGE